MSEATIAAIANAIGFIALIVLQVMAKMAANKKDKEDKAIAEKKDKEDKAIAESAAKKVEQVKIELESHNGVIAAALEDITKTAHDTHTLVNSNMAVQLKLNAELSRWKADQEPDNKAFKDAADKAERMYSDHVSRQSQVDKDVAARK